MDRFLYTFYKLLITFNRVLLLKCFNLLLSASETTDVSFTDSNMHVIWAIGQLPGGYVHIPDSGLEQGNSSVPDFYRKDELKYHGDRPQRGFGDLNFFRGMKGSLSAGN